MTQITKAGRGRVPATREEESALLSFQNEVNRLFDDFLADFGRPFWPMSRAAAAREFMPRVDVSETDGEVRVSAELPGMTEKDIAVELDDGTVTISGEKKDEEEEEQGGRYLRECSYGRFRRQLPLPGGVDRDKAKASFKNGKLRVTIPKSDEAKAKRRSIQISSE